jgi:hypothetical protein
MDTKADRQKWFEHLCRFSSTDAKVLAHAERGDENNTIEIFSAQTPDGALHSTIRLMEVNLGNAEAPLYTELLLDVESRDGKYAGVLSIAALLVLREKLRIGPGFIIEHAMRAYFPDHGLPHLMLVAPFQWKSGMTEVPLVTGTLHPLVAVPISNAERDMALARSPSAVGELWQSKKVNVLDVSRASAV